MWKNLSIDGQHTKYQVSRGGKIRNGKTGKLLTPHKKTNAVTLYHGRLIRRQLASLVLETFTGPDPSGTNRVLFKDGNPFNCSLSNLEWQSVAADRSGPGVRYYHVGVPSEFMTRIAGLRRDEDTIEEFMLKLMQLGEASLRKDARAERVAVSELVEEPIETPATPAPESETVAQKHMNLRDWPSLPAECAGWPRSFREGPPADDPWGSLFNGKQLTKVGQAWAALWSGLQEVLALEPDHYDFNPYRVLELAHIEASKGVFHAGATAKTKQYWDSVGQTLEVLFGGELDAWIAEHGHPYQDTEPATEPATQPESNPFA